MSMSSWVVAAVLIGVASASAAPVVHAEATFAVKEELGIPYAEGVLCNPQPCTPKDGQGCQAAIPGPPIPSSTGCVHPARTNLTLDLYTPIGAAGLGARPAFVAIHSGGYAKNSEKGFAPTYEMTAACRYFAARGFVSITMVYRLDNRQTGGALAPANWSAIGSPLPKLGWKGGFLPGPQAIWPAVRDSKAAIRWLRGQAGELNIDNEYFGAGGWSAGACTTAFLASQREWDFKTEMTAATDPTLATLVPYLNLSSAIKAGVVWAGNGAVTETKDALGHDARYASTNAPLAMYRGSEDSSMTPWAQQQMQAHFNASGARCDLFAVPGVGHSTLFPKGTVQTKNGVPVAGTPLPVLNHSFTWISEAMGLSVQ